jgi:hypothetical protein
MSLAPGVHCSLTTVRTVSKTFPNASKLYFAAAMSFPQRRIDDRIRLVCASLTAASNGDAEPALRELLRLVHQKADRLKSRAARLLLNGQGLDGERRRSFQ